MNPCPRAGNCGVATAAGAGVGPSGVIETLGRDLAVGAAVAVGGAVFGAEGVAEPVVCGFPACIATRPAILLAAERVVGVCGRTRRGPVGQAGTQLD